MWSNVIRIVLFQVMIKQECVRKSGYSVQADEEQLR